MSRDDLLPPPKASAAPVTELDLRREIKGFLVSRRARLTPEEVGLATSGGVRRVPGLRREEVARLAGVSIEYYSRLERGGTDGVSPEVLHAVENALRLDDDEREHLRDLVTISQRRVVSGGRSSGTAVRSELQRVLDAIDAPAFLQNARLDRLAANELGRALYSLPTDGSGDVFNYAEFIFLDPASRVFHRDWRIACHNVVALLHAASGRDPFDESLRALIGSLSQRSEAFRNQWNGHDVFRYRHGAKVFSHPTVGDLDFGYESFELPADDGLVMLVYSMTPGSPSEEAMRRLVRWSRTGVVVDGSVA